MLTFRQLKDSEVPAVVGVCPDSDQFRDYANKATRMLMTRGDFWGTVQKMNICVYNSCIVWPRQVGTVLAVNICGRPTEVWNHWYQFMPWGRNDFCSGLGLGLNGQFGWNGNGCFGNVVTINDATSPVFNPIPCNQNFYVRAYPSTQQDIGKKTRIFGVDENGQTIRTQNADLTWSDGVELTLALPFVSTPFKVRSVSRIIKDETQGTLRYYQYDADNDLLIDLVWLEPTETNPQFQRTRLPARCRAGSTTNVRCVDAMVKLEFIPVKYDTDLVQIDNLDALSDMMLAVKYSNGGDALMAKDFEAKALRDLNLQLRNKLPNEQTPVDVNPFGSARPERHCVGSII